MYILLYSKQEKVISEKLAFKKRLLFSCEVEIYDILQSYTQSLVGQVAVLDVAGRQLRGGLQRAVGDGHVVVVLVARAQALEDFDGLRDCRLMHLNRLETTFQRRVLLEIGRASCRERV